MPQKENAESFKRHNDASIEPRRSQRIRKERSLAFKFISSQALLFLLEVDKTNVTHKIPIILHIEEEDPKTFSEAMASRDACF